MNNLADITPIILAVIALCTVLLTSFIIPKLKAKHPQEEIDKALLCNLKLMKKALSKEQYGKYVALINATRANMESKVSNPMLDSYLAEK